MSNNNNQNISCIYDLKREERKVRSRIRNHESEIAERFKKLPEEIVTVAVLKVVSAVSSSDIVNNSLNYIHKITDKLFSRKEEHGSVKGAVLDGIFSVLKSFLKK